MLAIHPLYSLLTGVAFWAAVAAAPSPASAQTSKYLRLKVAVVVYPNTFTDSLTADELVHVWSEVDEAIEFFWRVSRMRTHLAVDREVIERLLLAEDFWFWEPGSYWLGPEAPENDLRELGYADDEHDAVVCFYAFAPSAGQSNKYGGATLQVNTLLGKAAYVGIPLSYDPNRYNRIFEHEFLHVFSSIFRNSGYPDFPNVHNVHEQVGVYDDNDTWYEWLLQSIPDDNYFNPTGVWGTVGAFPDSDSDRLADDASSLDDFPVTELLIGSSAETADTDGDSMSDLDEILAGIRRSSDPTRTDSDEDGIADGVDVAPVDVARTTIQYASPALDSTILDEEYTRVVAFGAPDPQDLSGELSMAWDEESIYFAIAVADDLIDTPWQDAGGNDAVFVRVDAASDGFLHQGNDNYEVIVSPSGPADEPLRVTNVWLDDKTRDPSLLPAEDVQGAYSSGENTWSLEFAVPWTALSFDGRPGATFRLQVMLQDRDGIRLADSDRPYSAFARWVPMTLGGEDCNDNRLPDANDIAMGRSPDCDANGVPDECELIGNDCNDNQVPDGCDLLTGTSNDSDTNGTPDDCQPQATLTVASPPVSVFLQDGNRALAYAGALDCASGAEGILWRGATFENVGTGDASAVVQKAELYLDTNDNGTLDSDDRSVGSPQTFRQGDPMIVFDGLSVTVAHGSSVSYLLVFDIPEGGSTSGPLLLGSGTQPPLALYIVLQACVVALVLGSRTRHRQAGWAVALLLALAPVLVAPGCGGGGGSGGQAPVVPAATHEIQMRLIDIDTVGTNSSEPAIVTGLPQPAWTFKV